MNFFKLNELAIEFRSDIGINHSDPIDFFPLITNKLKNLTIVFLEMDDEISGACYKFDTQKIMFINSNHPKMHQGGIRLFLHLKSVPFQRPLQPNVRNFLMCSFLRYKVHISWNHILCGGH